MRASLAAAPLVMAVAVLLVAATPAALASTSPASSALLPALSFGVNANPPSAGLQALQQAGGGVVRAELIAGADGTIRASTDNLVTTWATDGLTLYPRLGLPASNGSQQDAVTIAQYATAFAQRYGRGGSFWAAHPSLPYLPVVTYEIGNEPNMPQADISDDSHLHYFDASGNPDPVQFNTVYQAGRAAIHAVDPNATVVVGGLVDLGLPEMDSFLSGMGSMDALGFHPYVYLKDLMEFDTAGLRAWLDSHGDPQTPLDVNEFGSPSSLNTSAQWGAIVSSYTGWLMCTPSLDVESVLPFRWGGIAGAQAKTWLTMVTDAGALTDYGSAYLAEVSVLTQQGCPAVGPLASIVLNPSSSTIGTGTTQTYYAEGYDAVGNDLGDVTAQAAFAISGSGTCNANVCGATAADTYTVTATDDGVTGTAQLTVQPGPLASIVLKPSSSTIGTGTTQTYYAEGYDAVGNDLGDLTAQAAFAITGSGTCNANVCGATAADTYTVTASDDGLTGTAQLTVAIPLTIASISPTSGVVGASVTILGSGFTGTTSVSFAGVSAQFTVVSPSQLTAVVPSGGLSGRIDVSDPAGSATSRTKFLVKPQISSFTPSTDPVGTVVTIEGSAFTGATAVTFNGTPSIFTVDSYGQLTATVPGTATTGKIKVTTPGGSGTSSTGFVVTPTLTGLAPPSGSVGATVTITGTGLTGATIVKFHGTPAVFSVVSSTQITATVPVGASTGVISVRTAGGTVKSSTTFTVLKGTLR